MQTALKNRNLQLYFGGQIISLIGTWMQQMALSWLVYRLTDSTFMLGLIGFTTQVPSLVLSPFAGIVADRTNRHRLVIVIQVLLMIQAALLAALVLSNQAQLWHLVILSAFLGAITAFDLPTRQTFLVDMLDDDTQLTSAMGINSSINTLSRLVGPFVAGVLVTWAGEGTCFLINAVTYIAVIGALFFVRANQPAPEPSQMSGFEQLKEGFFYTVRFTPIRDLILLVALVGLVAMPFGILLPAFAKDVFHGDARTLGFLTGASGAGSVVGALYLTTRKGVKELGRWIAIACTMSGVSLIVFGMSHYFLLSLLAVAFLGFSTMLLIAGSNTVLQTIVDKDKRGRVMSFVVMAFMGLTPFGCMIAGSAAHLVGLGNTVVVSGILTLLLAFIFAGRVMSIHLQITPSASENALKKMLDEGVEQADLELAEIGK